MIEAPPDAGSHDYIEWQHDGSAFTANLTSETVPIATVHWTVPIPYTARHERIMNSVVQLFGPFAATHLRQPFDKESASFV